MHLPCACKPATSPDGSTSSQALSSKQKENTIFITWNQKLEWLFLIRMRLKNHFICWFIIQGSSLAVFDMNVSMSIISASEANAGYFTPYQSRWSTRYLDINPIGSVNRETNLKYIPPFYCLFMQLLPRELLEPNKGTREGPCMSTHWQFHGVKAWKKQSGKRSRWDWNGSNRWCRSGRCNPIRDSFCYCGAANRKQNPFLHKTYKVYFPMLLYILMKI